MKHIIEHTDDGSATLFVPELAEHYHSTKGARTESQHVFIDMGMKHSLREELRILEVGFGTGLNAFLSLLAATETHKKVHYTAIELYPLPWNVVDELQYTPNPLFGKLHTTPWETDNEITASFTLLKRNTDFTSFGYTNELPFDVVYFDAFAPEKQPEMWEQSLFDTLYPAMNNGGILTTYCAKGSIRRMLRQSGFTVERLPGPPGGKREILRATKI